MVYDLLLCPFSRSAYCFAHGFTKLSVLNAKTSADTAFFCEFIYFDLVFEGSGHWLGLGLEANLKVTIMFIRVIRNF